MLAISKKQKGFTIIEFIVVAVLLIIVTLLLLPSLTTYFSQNRLKSVAENLYNDILLGRTSAIQQSANVTMMFHSGTSWCYGMTTNASCTCTTPNSCNLGQTTSTEFPQTSLATTGLTANGTDTSITFDSVRGAPTFAGTTTNGTATLSSTVNNQQITITINQLGTSTVCSGGTVGGYGC